MGSGASNLTLSSDLLSQLKVQAEKPNDVSDTTNYIDEIIKIRTLLSTSGLEKINEFQSEFEKPIDGSDIQTDDDAKAELISKLQEQAQRVCEQEELSRALSKKLANNEKRTRGCKPINCEE